MSNQEKIDQNKALVKSLIRDLFMAFAAAGINARYSVGPTTLAKDAAMQADALLSRSRTPGILDKMEEL